MSRAAYEAEMDLWRQVHPGTSHLQGALDAMKQAEVAWTEAAFVNAEAVGIWIDDMDDPNVAVAVHGGRIVYIGISDGMLRVPQDQLQDVLNACIFNAFGMWRAQTKAEPATA